METPPPPAPGSHLPVVEPDRDLDDWGRSARASDALDGSLLEAAHKVWFRIELQHAARIPGRGGGVLVVNGGGALSPIAPLLAKAIREDHPRRRIARPCADPAVLDQPGLSVLLTRIGVVRAHDEDLARLLRDERELVIVSVPTQDLQDEDAAGALARHPAVRAAVQVGAPLLPVAAIGIDDAQPVLGRLPLPGGRRLPVTLAFPHLGPLGLLLYLPAKIRLRALDPQPTTAGADDRQRAVGAAVATARALRAATDELRRERGSRWLG